MEERWSTCTASAMEEWRRASSPGALEVVARPRIKTYLGVNQGAGEQRTCLDWLNLAFG